MIKKFEDRPKGFNEYINHLGKTVRIDPTKAHNLLALKEAAISTGGDLVLVYDGQEGSGKSTQARQDGKLLDPTLDESRIEFTPENAVKCHFKGLPDSWDPESYMEGKYTNKPWQVIILDESAKLDRKRTMSSSSIEFTGFMTQSRQLHKIFIIVLPSVHMLDGYVAEHRTVALINCYKHENQSMGFYKWFSRRHLKTMFTTEMHKRRLYPHNPNFSGRFSKADPFDLTNYERKKAAALNAYRKAIGAAIADPAELRYMWEMHQMRLAIEKDIPLKYIRAVQELSSATFSDRKKILVQKLEQEGKKIEPKEGPASRVNKGIDFKPVSTEDKP